MDSDSEGADQIELQSTSLPSQASNKQDNTGKLFRTDCLQYAQLTVAVEPSFRFISCPNPEASKDRTKHREARSHGVRQSHLEKRRRLIAQQDNFRVLTPDDLLRKSVPRRQSATSDTTPAQPICDPLSTTGFEKVDPLNATSVDYNRMRQLLSHPKACQALEPVFSVSQKFQHESFGTVIRAGIKDPTIANALMMSLTLVANDGLVDAEFLRYKEQAMQRINSSLISLSHESIHAAICAILLLIGVEWRLGITPLVEAHFSGLQQLFKLCNDQSIYISDAIKRAMFWQDLMSALTAGTARTVNHDAFPELHWQRDTTSSLYVLPSGFAQRRYMFSNSLILVFEDIRALQQLRSLPEFDPPDALNVRHVDNQQAWIESRLFDMHALTDLTDHLTRSCILAAYLVTYELFSEIWTAELIPSHCATTLLRHLDDAQHYLDWTGHEDLLAWLLFVGGTFAPSSAIRRQYAILLHGTYRTKVACHFLVWTDLQILLKTFFWSEALFNTRAKQFWNTSCVY